MILKGTRTRKRGDRGRRRTVGRIERGMGMAAIPLRAHLPLFESNTKLLIMD